MIGRITWDAFGGRITAEMGDDRTFAVGGTDPGLAESIANLLDSEYEAADSEHGPAAGRPGVLFLERMAREVGGRLELAPAPPEPEGGVVY